MGSASVTNRAVSDRSWHLVRIALACVLLTASALKCWQLATEPATGTGLLESRPILMVTVEFELFFGFLLLANIWAKPSWALALACFGLFTCVSVCKALSGHASCGCFGRVSVNPWYTGILDLAVVVSLLRSRPKESYFTTRRAIAVLVIWLLIGFPAAYAMARYTPTRLSDMEDILGKGKVVVLEPEKWIGKPFPLLDYIDIGAELREGEWGVLLYHHDCPQCREMMRDVPRITKETGVRQVCLLEMPPYGDLHVALDHMTRTIRLGKLDNKRDWFAATPILMVLKGGRVVAMSIDK